MEDTHTEVGNSTISALLGTTRFRQRNRVTSNIRKIARFDRVCVRQSPIIYTVPAEGTFEQINE